MDLFTGDHRIPSSDDFPQHVAPFPDPTDLLYAAPSAVFPPADIIAHLPNPPPPPQKLRPIRCSGRSPAGSQADNIFDGALRNFHGVSSSPEGGFSGDQLCVASIDPCEYFNSSAKEEKPEVKDNGGFGDIIGNNYFSEEETKNGGSGAVIAAENLSRSREGPQLDDDSWWVSTLNSELNIASWIGGFCFSLELLKFIYLDYWFLFRVVGWLAFG